MKRLITVVCPPGNDDNSSRTKQVGVGGVDKSLTGMLAEAKHTHLQ